MVGGFLIFVLSWTERKRNRQEKNEGKLLHINLSLLSATSFSLTKTKKFKIFSHFCKLKIIQTERKIYYKAKVFFRKFGLRKTEKKKWSNSHRLIFSQVTRVTKPKPFNPFPYLFIEMKLNSSFLYTYLYWCPFICIINTLLNCGKSWQRVNCYVNRNLLFVQ